MPERAPYRVVQWATGTVGRAALQAVIDHPGLELVGVHVHSAAKDGRDAGDLAGRPPTGVKATRDIDAVIALKPDCVLYMQEGADYDDLCRLLENGANIVTTRGEFFNPKLMAPAVRERVEAACRQGGTSLYATGSSPGFITEVLPLALTSVQRRLDRLTIDEFADILPACSPEMIFEVMGFGDTPEAFAKRPVAERDECFVHALSQVAAALGKPIEGHEVAVETATARQPIPVGDREIAVGTVAAQRITTSLLHAGRPLLQFRANWFCSTDIEPAWELRATGWRVQVVGDAPLDVQIAFPLDQAGDAAEIFPRYTANRPVNAIPYVCAAAPGIVTTVELPPVIAQLL